NDVREIGMTIANELRALIDYHNCRVFVVDGEDVVPIAFRGDLSAPPSTTMEVLKVKVGAGITGHVVATGDPVLTGDAALLEFARELATAKGLDDVLDRTVTQTARIIGSERTSVWIQDPDTGELVPRALHGHAEEEREESLQVRHSREFVERLLLGSEPFKLEPGDVEGLEGVLQAEIPYLVAPLVLDDGTHGCIAAALPLDDPDYLERPLRLLAGLAHQAKLAIANANSFDSLEGTFISTVEALANALEANDEYTSSHARWITDTALQVGASLGLDGNALKRLELGALFHDIGKIGIPSEILSKPGRLTADERRVIETHPELGERIIAPIHRLQDVRPIVRHCHERYDGAGYPDQIAGEEIPLESRIVFVCDALDRKSVV